MIMRADCTKTDAERQASAKNNKPPQHVDRALPNTNKRGGRAVLLEKTHVRRVVAFIASDNACSA